jgi:hypothetical protein
MIEGEGVAESPTILLTYSGDKHGVIRAERSPAIEIGGLSGA